MDEQKQEQGIFTEKLLKIISGLIVLANFGLSFWAYPNLPDKVPTHWNAAGEIDGYAGTLQGAFLMPVILLGIYIMFFVIPKIDPKRANYTKMGRVFWSVSLAIILFMSVVHFGSLSVALGYIEKMPSLIYTGLGLLFLVLGNYMGKVKHNYTFGIRNPWTLASETVWYKTHRFAGPLWMLSGVLFFFTGFIPAAFVSYWIFIIIGIAALIPTAYSYLVYAKLSKEIK